MANTHIKQFIKIHVLVSVKSKGIILQMIFIGEKKIILLVLKAYEEFIEKTK